MYGHAQTSGYQFVNSNVDNHTTYNSASKVTIFKSQAFINGMNLVYSGLWFLFTRSHVRKVTLASSHQLGTVHPNFVFTPQATDAATQTEQSYHHHFGGPLLHDWTDTHG